jgi:hypothetical protein
MAKSVLPSSTKPTEIADGIRDLGRIWASSISRPRIVPSAKASWDALVDLWAGSDLPLAIRKSGGIRGKSLIHSSGRILVLADNSPAHWAFTRAYANVSYGLSDIRLLLEQDQVPFAYATKRSEKANMTYRCTLSSADNVNKQGWKLCHIQEIGLGTKINVCQVPLETLIQHFRLLMKPSNHFLVPLQWAGLGELPEFISEIRKVESAAVDAAIA